MDFISNFNFYFYFDMGMTLSGKKPGGTDATFKWLLHTGSATLEGPRRVTTGGGLDTVLVIGADTLGLMNANGFTATLDPGNLTASRSYSLPDAQGILPAVPSHANATAANAAVAAGDAWWDTTLKKLRVRLS